MKLDKLLFAVLAAGVLASCSNEDNSGVTLPGTGSSVETSYIAVNVNGVFDRIGRADDGGYEDGSEAEQKVTNAHFFFFDSNGAAFELNAESLTDADAVTNHIEKNLADSNNEQDPNVETITNAVLTIQNSKEELPTQMVVVLNWDGVAADMVSLAELRAELLASADLNGTNGFVMSNSVYANNGKVVDVTPITPANIATSSDAALLSPIEVYVERVAAKVKVAQAAATFDTGVENPGAAGGNIYAKIAGWDVNTVLDNSYILKNINPSWSENLLGGILWNDMAYRRSYWANSVAGTYETEFSWNGVSAANAIDGVTYCAENAGDYATEYTKVLAAAEFVDADGNKVEVARLFNEYLTIDDLKKRIAASLAESFYYGNNDSKTSIDPAHIDFEAAGTSADDSYKVAYILTDAAKALTWYEFDGANYNSVSADDVEARLATLTKAEIWNGMGYYYVDIEHLSSGVGAPTVYGVVRNHSYVITVDAIKGLGTAVYDADNVVEEPVTPSGTESFIAARINVLSWKLVNQNVTLE